MEKFLIYGCRDFGKILRNLLKECNLNFAGFISDFDKGNEIIGNFEYVKQNYNPNEFSIINGLGYADLRNRWEIYMKIISAGYEVPNIIHPKAIISKSVKMGKGSIFMAGSIVDFNTEIKDLSVFWPGVIINHDCKIGNNNFFSPGSITCGFVDISDNCFIGAGATIIDHIKIENNKFILAGKIISEKSQKNIQNIKDIRF